MLRAAAVALSFAAMCAAEYVDGEFIVVMSRNASSTAHRAVQKKFGGERISVGRFRAVHVAGVDEVARASLGMLEGVEYVEKHVIGHIMQACPAEQTEPVSWGTVRVTVPSASDVLQVFAHDPQWGAGVDAYVLDTGIMCSHQDFTGRCDTGRTFVGGNGQDGHGHGTHVAGTIGGTTWGIAKKVNFIAGKVCTNYGVCPTGGVLRAFEWVAGLFQASRRPSVVNLSLGGGFSQAYNDAANELVTLGVSIVAAAGNSNENACGSSPASAESIITTGATELANVGGNQVDNRSPFSNWGTCVDVFAPGSAIVSAGISTNSSAATFSGTSMASPQVAGVVAQYLSVSPTATPAQVKTHIIQTASADLVLDPNGTPNRMLHIRC